MRRLYILVALLTFGLSACDEGSSVGPTPIVPDASLGADFITEPRIVTLYETGAQGRVLVRLLSQPTADVMVHAEMSDTSEFTLNATSGVIAPNQWEHGYAFYLQPIDDGVRDGDQEVALTFRLTSVDPAWQQVAPMVVPVTILDNGTVDPSMPTPEPEPDPDPDPEPEPNPEPPVPVSGVKIRLMAANTTCGDDESYDCLPSQRIFKAIQPDIVLLQEFKVLKTDDRTFVDEVFGPEFYYYKGGVGASCTTTPKPNGIISRYPILETGEWTPQYYYNSEPHYRPAYVDRNWTWAVVDVPGDRELLVVSVHLHTDKNKYEFFPLAEHITAKQKEGNYYVAFGGDFNTKNASGDRTPVLETQLLADMFYMKKGEYPVDQKGREQTNKKRGSILDYLLFSKDLEVYEIPLEIGQHTGSQAYPNGHVFDSRIYEEVGELYHVQPVEAGDSGAVNMQHMPVIRDIALPED